jgi:ParB-like chromosome segregation protein Spo0J
MAEHQQPELTTLADLTPDRRNARRRTPRSANRIARSLEKLGAARSIVIDEDGRILAGNGTVEAAAEVGIERVQVVETDGRTLIAVRRRGLSEAEKVELAIADNRTAELSEWDDAVLGELADEVDLSDWFLEDELDELTETESGTEPAVKLLRCPHCGETFDESEAHG